MSCDVLEFTRLADNEIRIQLIDPRTTGESPTIYINAGTVTATLYNPNDEIASGPVDLTYQNSSDGMWVGEIESNENESPVGDAFDAPVGVDYYLVIVIESDTGASLTARRKASVIDG